MHPILYKAKIGAEVEERGHIICQRNPHLDGAQSNRNEKGSSFSLITYQVPTRYQMKIATFIKTDASLFVLLHTNT